MACKEKAHKACSARYQSMVKKASVGGLASHEGTCLGRSQACRVDVQGLFLICSFVGD